jgi:succinate dehydrogenase / fumarate reductase cytochrome b subunit
VYYWFPQATNRTAVFLLFFLIIHCAGNLLVFLGADAFNAYGHVLHVNPVLFLIESYLLLATVFHACGGLWLTWKKRKFIARGSTATVLDNAKMALSSVLVLAFLVVHLVQFRFGAWYDYASTMDITVLSEAGVETVPKGTAMRDIFKHEKEVFADPLNVWGYVGGLLALGSHVWWGWARAVKKMGLAAEDVPAADALGKFLFAPVILGFVSQPLYVHYFMKA